MPVPFSKKVGVQCRETPSRQFPENPAPWRNNQADVLPGKLLPVGVRKRLVAPREVVPQKGGAEGLIGKADRECGAGKVRSGRAFGIAGSPSGSAEQKRRVAPGKGGAEGRSGRASGSAGSPFRRAERKGIRNRRVAPREGRRDRGGLAFSHGFGVY